MKSSNKFPLPRRTSYLERSQQRSLWQPFHRGPSRYRHSGNHFSRSKARWLRQRKHAASGSRAPATSGSGCFPICRKRWPRCRRKSGPMAVLSASRSRPPSRERTGWQFAAMSKRRSKVLNDLGVVVDEWSGSNSIAAASRPSSPTVCRYSPCCRFSRVRNLARRTLTKVSPHRESSKRSCAHACAERCVLTKAHERSTRPTLPTTGRSRLGWWCRATRATSKPRWRRAAS